MEAGIPEIIEVAEVILNKFILLPENPKPERIGGYLHILDVRKSAKPDTWFTKNITVSEVGCCPGNMLKTFDICQEKNKRLASHLPNGHISSWESRNVENQQYGGSIITPEDSLISDDLAIRKMGSFSGLVELGDEALILVLFLNFKWMTWSDAQKIAKISRNGMLTALANACRNHPKLNL